MVPRAELIYQRWTMAAVLGIFVWHAWSGIPPFAGRTSPKQAVPPLVEPCRNNLAGGGQQGGEEEEKGRKRKILTCGIRSLAPGVK